VRSGLLVLAAGFLSTVLAAPLPAAPTPDSTRSTAPPVPALECSLENGRIFTHVFVPQSPAADLQRREVLTSLERGLTAGIVFQIRLYEPARGFSGLLGDRLLAESLVTRTVRWDPFVPGYLMLEIVDDEEETSTSEADSSTILDAFFSTRVGRIVTPSPRRAGAYVLARYRLSAVQVHGGLRLVSIFFGDLRARDSPWSRQDIGGGP
jgi:hypothetical protein